MTKAALIYSKRDKRSGQRKVYTYSCTTKFSTAVVPSTGTGVSQPSPPSWDHVRCTTFWVPEPKTFLELHSKTLLKHFFHRERKHLLSTGTSCQVRGTLRGPCTKKRRKVWNFKNWPKIATFTVPLRGCVGKFNNWQVALRDIGFGWQPRALVPDLKSLLKIQIEIFFNQNNFEFRC